VCWGGDVGVDRCGEGCVVDDAGATTCLSQFVPLVCGVSLKTFLKGLGHFKEDEYSFFPK
jgi:hypothetical protein